MKDKQVIPKNQTAGGWYSRGYIPHFDVIGLTQHVVFRLFDSLPQNVLAQWEEELKHLSEKDADLERRLRIEHYLDQGYGSCYLREATVAELVQNALLFFDDQRYQLHAWCVMPNHVHVLFTALAGHELGKIVHSWKSFTANEANRHLEREGQFWQKEPYDRYIRNERHFRNAVEYIENNPVKAGLCAMPADWPWSSAALAWERPLPSGL